MKHMLTLLTALLVAPLAGVGAAPSGVGSPARSAADEAPAVGPKPERQKIHSQPSFILVTPQVELAVTLTGGHTAPVTFFRDTAQPVQPYHLTPWQDEPPTPMPAPLLAVLRGDFFCLLFGCNAEEMSGERHPPHEEVAGSPWTFVSQRKTGDVTTLTLDIDTKVRRSRVTKELSLIDGQNVIYSRHTIEGFAGRAPLGPHATLAMPEKEGAVRITTSKIRFGMTAVGLFSDPLMSADPALKCIMANTSPAVPDAAEAVKQAGKSGVVKVLRLGLPRENRAHVKEGVTQAVILWDLHDLGYLTVKAAAAVACGTLKPGANSFEAGRLGAVKIAGDNVLLGTPITFTNENIDKYQI